ncbi:hypothetical protein BJ912DRAFT_533434 [Pholiota molesta]|nr:hypothetical protein BJ912DRAFT_533434 [Pholiota molesta]
MSIPTGIPPRTYTIQSKESSPRGVVCPDPVSATLDLSLLLVGQDPTVKNVEQSWNITGDGCIKPMFHPDKYVSVNIDAGIDGAPVIISASAQGDVGAPVSSESANRIFWTFGIPGDGDEHGPYSCSIYMTHNNQNYYWGSEANSKNIRLTTKKYHWTFTKLH